MTAALEGILLADDMAIVVAQPTGVSSLDWLQSLVASPKDQGRSLIEPVFFHEDCEAYVHEEGKYVHPRNDLATKVWLGLLNLNPDAADMVDWVRAGNDWICGPVVFLGPLDAEGEDTSITDKMAELILRHVLGHGGMAIYSPTLSP